MASLKQRIELIEVSLTKVVEVVSQRQGDLVAIQEELDEIANHLAELKEETVGS